MFRRIRWKLLATYLIVVFPTLVFLGVHLTRQFELAYADQLRRDLLGLARLLAAAAADDLLAANPEALGVQVAALGAGPEAPSVVVVDAAGRVVAAQGVAGLSPGVLTAEPSLQEALSGREPSGVGAPSARGKTVYATVPVRAAGRVLGAVHVARPLTYLHGQVRHVRWVVAWATVVALIIAVALAFLLARNIAGPVQEMRAVARDLAAGRLGERVPVRTRDELGDLARSLNYMAGELERIDSLRRQFVADASHELRTPVANLAVAVEALKTVLGEGGGTAARVAADLEHEVTRLRRLVEDLLDLTLVESGQVPLHLAAVAPAELVARALQSFRGRAVESEVTLRTELPTRLPPMKADPDRIAQVLTNLLDNALKHTPRGGEVVVGAVEQRGHVLLSVADTGPGIPAVELPHIFDRFYKVDKARSNARGGAGLGLAIAKRLVEAQGGIIMVENQKGRGARFVIALPKVA